MSAKIKTKKPETVQGAILSEISKLEHQLRADKRATEKAALKVEKDFNREAAKLEKSRRAAMALADKAVRAAQSLEKKRVSAHWRIAIAHGKRGAATRRRLAILESRIAATT